MKLLGIDNGKSGSCALYNTLTEEVDVVDNEVLFDGTLDSHWFFTKLNEWEPDAAIIEFCFNNNGLVEMGGEFISVCKLMQVPIQKVSATKWKKAVLGSSANNKPLSVKKCCDLLPQANISRPTPAGRKTNLDHNRAEAVLLALYLSRNL